MDDHPSGVRSRAPSRHAQPCSRHTLLALRLSVPLHELAGRLWPPSVVAGASLVTDHQPIRDLRLLLLAEDEEFFDFCSQVFLSILQAAVTHRIALGGICVDLASVQADSPQFEHTCLLCQEQYLDKEVLEILQEDPSKGG